MIKGSELYPIRCAGCESSVKFSVPSIASFDLNGRKEAVVHLLGCTNSGNVAAGLTFYGQNSYLVQNSLNTEWPRVVPGTGMTKVFLVNPEDTCKNGKCGDVVNKKSN